LKNTAKNKAKSEPLHLKNNTTKELFMKILKAVLSVAEIPSSVKMFSELSSLNLLSYFIGFVAKDMNCNYLAKKLRQWFNESSDLKNEKNFSFRFRGKESYHFLQHFPMLIASLIQKIDSTDFHFHLFQVFYQSLMLRKLVSFSVRINDISMSDIDEMEKVGRSLFKCCCIYDSHVTPSMWVFCNIAPKQSKSSFRELKFGLGINTTEGREQKHQVIKKYARNSTFQERWKFIFRQEFLQSIHLRENGFDTKKYRVRNVKYVPTAPVNHCLRSCVLNEKKCILCDSTIMCRIIKEVGYFF